MLGQKDSFAVGSVAGFGWRDLHNGDWLAPPPPELNRGANTLDALARFLQVTR
jgi:hypothetical protein